LGISDFFSSVKRIVHVARKPSKSRFKTSLKASLVGLGVLGAAGFVAELTSSVLSTTPLPKPSLQTLIPVIVGAIIGSLIAIIIGRVRGWW